MAKYLIEVPHDPEEYACAIAARTLLETGSHFLTHADFGCKDGVHKAWISVDADSKLEALAILPPLYRPHAMITGLNRFTLDELDDLIEHHQEG